MIMTPGLRKFALTAHVTSAVGWLGAVAGFLALAVAGVTSEDAQMVRAADLAMGLIAWFVILPLSLAALLTGLVQALGTQWGLFRHYWVVAKFLLTILAVIVLALKMGPISYLSTSSSADLAGLRFSLMAHAAGGLLVLLAIATLAIYKPPGITPYGGSSTSTPRWVKVFGTVVIVLIVLVGIMMLGGEHGPGAHVPRP